MGLDGREFGLTDTWRRINNFFNLISSCTASQFSQSNSRCDIELLSSGARIHAAKAAQALFFATTARHNRGWSTAEMGCK